MGPPTWAITFTEDSTDKIHFGEQAEAQNSKDLSDEVNSKRDVVFQMIFQCWQKLHPI